MSVTATRRQSAPSTRSSSGMLQQGSKGPEVLELQKALAAAGFNPHGFDGSFGPKTKAALLAFQRAAGITVDGRAGPQTWNALRARAPSAPAPSAPAPSPAGPTLRKGDMGPDVRKLQTLLEQHGVRTGGVDGNFGPMTQKAVTAFQRAKGLNANGVAGPETWAALAQSPSSQPPVTGPSAPTAPTGPASEKIQTMLNWAKSMLGTPYAAVNPFRFGDVLWDGKAHKSVNGSDTVWQYPKGTRVFDCSGFVVAAYRQLGVDLAARGLASTSTFHADTKFLQPLDRDQLAPGDLIMYQPKNGIGHVVIYMGDGKAIEAAGGKGVVINNVDWDRVKSYRRVPVS
jgi:peptidoglycan hydrolase-like protein with peptidoglycan-binding domain